MKHKYKIAIVAGGTGGHIFPAISLAEQLILEKKKVLFLSDNRTKKIFNNYRRIFSKDDIKFYHLQISRKIKDFFNFFNNLYKIFCIIIKENPKIVIGFGGYTSIPFLIISKILLKPLILHEQNIILGSANKLFLLFSKKVIFGLGDKNKKVLNKRFFYIRNPVRKKILILRRKKFNYNKKKISLLIVGGSQGATIFDNLIPKTINLLPLSLKRRINIFHQCSKNNLRVVKKSYREFKINAVCKSFYNNLPEVMFNSQFVISRCGASTLSEILTLGKPCILIPYKFAKKNHQEKNADWLVKNGVGVKISEKELTKDLFRRELIDFIKNKKKLIKMSNKSFSLGDNKSLIKLSKLIN